METINPLRSEVSLPRATGWARLVLPGLLALFAMGPVAGAPSGEIAVPAAGHRVVDEAKVLSPAEIGQLADRLQALEEKTQAQVAILTVASTGGEAIAPFANRVFVAWGLGRKGVDDGVLIVLSTGNRRVRIEVGRGLEGSIPDVDAKRITADVMAPYFKEGKYAQGMDAGIDALAGLIEPGAKSDSNSESTSDSSADANAQAPPPPEDIGVRSSDLFNPLCGSALCNDDLIKLGGVALLLLGLGGFIVYTWRHTRAGSRGGGGGSSGGSSGSSDSSSSSSNDSSGGGGDSAGGGSDSSY